MIVTKIKGGVGNQLFQYALGRHLAEINKSHMLLDISDFETFELRNPHLSHIKYSLSHFNIQEDIMSLEEYSGKIDVDPRLEISHINEKYFHYDPSVLDLSGGIYIEGYWQSEKYFKAIEQKIKREFSFKNPPKGTNKDLADMISQTESVAIHVRRGDYVKDEQTKLVHGALEKEYFLYCVNILQDKLNNPYFFIFSDDHLWVDENFRTVSPAKFVTNNRLSKDYEDFRLMSLCKHQIIANSTFSWWAAWLNNNHDKMVMAPKKWFNVSHNNIKDLYPDSWTVI